MNIETSVAVQIVGGALVAGFIQGISGFAFGLIATSIWAWTIEPQLVVPTVIFGSLLGQMISISSVRKDIRAARAGPFGAGSSSAPTRVCKPQARLLFTHGPLQADENAGGSDPRSAPSHVVKTELATVWRDVEGLEVDRSCCVCRGRCVQYCDAGRCLELQGLAHNWRRLGHGESLA